MIFKKYDHNQSKKSITADLNEEFLEIITNLDFKHQLSFSHKW